MSSSSEESPPGSPSLQSPAASQHTISPPNLDRLVLHFVAAKRSLTATTLVSRADELVTHSRRMIEEIAVLTATNVFAQRGLHDQVEVLSSVKSNLLDDAEIVSNEFAETIASLDAAHRRLELTLEGLRTTVTDKTLSNQSKDGFNRNDNSSTADGSSAGEDDHKTLFDFVDDNAHEELLSGLRGLIDSFHYARADLDRSLSPYDDALKEINTLLSGSEDGTTLEDKLTIYDDPPSSLNSLFRSMEEHAAEVASLLNNLVNHYDLCVTALKHTEGGGEAAKEAVMADGLGKGTTEPEESLYRRTVPEPMDDEERTEMLLVLEKDAQEVDDVTGEIRDRQAEMEQRHQQMSRLASRARLRNGALHRVLDLLHKTRVDLPVHVDAVQVFRSKWQDIQVEMRAKTAELSELSGFYEQFISGYGKLLREVDRRAASELQMRKLAEKARREIGRLYEVDQRAREEFMEEVGAFLPSNIWDGLADEAPRWEVQIVPTV